MALIKLQNTMLEDVQVPWNQPYLLRGFCKTMGAVKQWKDVDYLKKHFMNAEVDVEYYKNKTDFETSISSIKTQKFNDYFDTYSKKVLYLNVQNLKNIFSFYQLFGLT